MHKDELLNEDLDETEEDTGVNLGDGDEEKEDDEGDLDPEDLGLEEDE